MLSVPNLIDCADGELLVIGEYGERPIEGIRNIRRKEYFEEVKKRLTVWLREMQKQVYKTKHLFYIRVND